MPRTATEIQDLEPREQEIMRLMQSGALPQAEVLIKEVLDDRPDDPKLLNTLGAVIAQQGRIVEALPMIKRAFEQMPDDASVNGNLLAAKQVMEAQASSHVTRGDWPQALAAYREILALFPDNTFAPNLIIHYALAAGETPRLADYAPDLSEDELGRHIFIACMPESGSTFLKMAFIALTGWQEALLTYAFLQNEGELYLPHLRSVARQDTVTQLHCRATVPNVQMMQAFGIRPTILVRNLLDVVVSYTDFFDGGATVNTFFAGRWANLSRERRLDLVIDNFVPWYTAFFTSWADVMAKGQLDCHFLRYEDMIANKSRTLERLSAFYDLEKSPEECATALRRVEAEKEMIRFNKGKAGRGDELTKKQNGRIRALAEYYHNIDFSPVGL